MRASVLGYLLLGVFFVSERFLREGEEARSLQAADSDQGTTRLIGVACGYALNAGLVAPFLSRFGVGRISDPVLPPLGLALMALGLSLKFWAMRTLGRFYTRTLRTAINQPIVEAGPYGYVRHPGYLGALLQWIGFSLTSRNWVVMLSITLLMVVAYTKRIAAEEAMMERTLGEPFAGYRRRTWRVLPGAY